ncbi:MAG TPA: hypothetical protein VLF21_03580 [Candidatus Saccharimonadales bacterium]|nr:hypothetical protein [Candidatus Saccharimonadales bacterium]
MRKLIFWLGQAVIITIIFVTIYAAVQQNYRQNANDPQASMVIGLAGQITQGTDVELGQVPKIDPSKSLTPFAIIYDDQGKVVDSNVELDGKTPELPAGVFANTRKVGEERITWQPTANVRLAAVIAHHDGKKPGFVLAARSLKEVEEREAQLQTMVALAWLLSLVTLGLSVTVLHAKRL